jgi:diguanylate cyclase (GGDEF)-like protein
MTNNPSPAGMTLLCNGDGILQHVVRDEFAIQELIPGQALEKLADPGSRARLRNFLGELFRNDRLLIVGAHHLDDLLGLCDEMVKIGLKQADVLRSAIKRHLQISLGQGDEQAGSIEEVNRLKKQLGSLEHLIARKNEELERLNGEVQKQVIVDPLTGLFNQRGFFEIGDREIERSRRFNHPLAAIMFDVDHFKKINDTYGHATGDQVLKEVTVRCKQQARKVDIFGRVGGDEFALLLLETHLQGALTVAERLRLAANNPNSAGKTRLLVTISLGVAVLSDKNANLQELLSLTYQALHIAKESGRNCAYTIPE